MALQQGATGLESDVWVTADGVPVLDHDGIVRRSFGRGKPIAGVRRSELPEHIPSLAELLDQCGTEFDLSLDLKDPASGQRVVDIVSEVAPQMLTKVWLCAPVWETLLPLRGTGVRLVDSTRLGKLKDGPERRAATLHQHGIDAINLHHSDWNGGLVALFHRFERVVFGWDTQEPRIIAMALHMGLDGVYCDSPDQMMAVFAEMLGNTPPATASDA